jgi:hypothetical protein
MTELWPWLVLTGLGIFHGLNPAMGWHAVGWAWKLAMSDSEKLTEIQHTEVATGRTYEALVEAFEHELGYLDPLIGARPG